MLVTTVLCPTKLQSRSMMTVMPSSRIIMSVFFPRLAKSERIGSGQLAETLDLTSTAQQPMISPLLPFSSQFLVLYLVNLLITLPLVAKLLQAREKLQHRSLAMTASTAEDDFDDEVRPH